MNTSQIETQPRGPQGTANVLRSLPRSPTPCTECLVTTTVTSAFHRNSQKRGFSDLLQNAPPPTPIHGSTNNSNNSSSSKDKDNTSYLDCQSLQSSLKRVRLSSSPGELRLQRDLRHLVASDGWQKQTRRGVSPNDDVYIWNSQDRQQQQQQQQQHVELLQVESLRLRLTIYKKVVVWIQVPRMYPHRPPLVSCIVYPTQQGQSCPHHTKRIQRILVLEEPPRRNHVDDDGRSDAAAGSEDSSGQQVHYSADTAIYKEWSPVKTLSDLLQFVIQVLNSEDNDLQTSASSSFLTTTATITTTAEGTRRENFYGEDCNSMDTTTNTTITNTTSTILDSQDTTALLLPNAMTARQKSLNFTLGVSPAKAKQLFTFPPNRFDLGYDRDTKLLLPMDTTIGRASPVVATVSMDITN